jgi:ribose transport system substrate-binding protein
MFSNDDASVSTRRTFINTVAAAGGAALFGRLGISPALAVEATERAERPLKAAFSNAGL